MKLAVTALCLVVLSSASGSTPDVAPIPPVANGVLPAVKLRGYGVVSGQWKSVAGGSVLTIHCASEAKAQLVQAKYVSDLQSLPGVTTVQMAGTDPAIPGFLFGTNAFLAAREGAQVFILTAKSTGSLGALERSSLPQGHLVFKPEVNVPMYLDRWDKYGFRFYYAPLTTPDGQTLSTYDKNTDLAWSEKNQTGIQLWDPLYEFDTAHGITTRHDIQWTIDAAQAHHLPIGINLSVLNQLWLENWFPYDMAQMAPDFLGSFYNGPMGMGDGSRFISWNSTTAEDMELGTLQQDVKALAGVDNVTSWLEPHGEIAHGNTDFLMEYGPLADKTYRDWLRKKYSSVETVSRRWTGKSDAFKRWDDIHVPEMANFCGWNGDALDLAGKWRVDYPPIDAKGDGPVNYPTDTFAATCDDSRWPEIVAPGDANAMFLPKTPAIFRRTFNVDGAWLKAHPRVWLYEFDINETNDKEIIATLNGKEIGRSKVQYDHYGCYEATSALKEGANVLALALPEGYLAYRVYLSGTEPHPYPYLGAQLNAQWADFTGWAAWSRVQKVQRGMEMIRQVDPDRGIIMMTPGTFAGGEQELAKRYGGDFHDTGGMQGWWNTFYPEMMNGVGLPCTVETGGPDHDVNGLSDTLGRFSTEGIQGVDYFLQIGDLFWHPEMKAKFEENLKLWKLIGKYHVAPPQYATFYSGRDAALATFPFNFVDRNLLVPMGYVPWDWHDDRYPGTAGISEDELLNGSADKYKVIFDSNSSILDQDIIDAIGAYVKQGGIFVTYVQTGRHSPTEPNSWPISKLTGYSVTGIDPFPPDDTKQHNREIAPAPNQSVFTASTWKMESSAGSAGLSLKKVAADCQDLLVWKDGSIAAGMRPLGKGYIFNFGVKYDGMGWGDHRGTNQIFDAVLDFAKIRRDPIQLQNSNFPGSPDEVDPNQFYYRHFLSNNGLYDVFSFWNHYQRTVAADLVFPVDAPALANAIRVKTGESMPLSKNSNGQPVLHIQLDGGESQSFLVPHADVSLAARQWFDLQREWWKGTDQPPAKALPGLAAIHRDTVPLGDDWLCKSVADADSAKPLVAAHVDDSTWDKRKSAAQLIPLPDQQKPPQVMVYRKRFTIPADWSKGSITLWMTVTEGDAFYDSAQVFCDGAPVKVSYRSVFNQTFDPPLKPGSTHVLAVISQSKSCLIGNAGASWLYYRPDANEQMDLAGEWATSDDGLRFDTKATVPGPWNTHMARRTVTIPLSHAQQTVMLHCEYSGAIVGAVFNGRWISQSHVANCPTFDLNLTPWVKFGKDNSLEVLTYAKSQASIRKLTLDFYNAENRF